MIFMSPTWSKEAFACSSAGSLRPILVKLWWESLPPMTSFFQCGWHMREGFFCTPPFVARVWLISFFSLSVSFSFSLLWIFFFSSQCSQRFLQSDGTHDLTLLAAVLSDRCRQGQHIWQWRRVRSIISKYGCVLRRVLVGWWTCLCKLLSFLLTFFRLLFFFFSPYSYSYLFLFVVVILDWMFIADQRRRKHSSLCLVSLPLRFLSCIFIQINIILNIILNII